MKDVFEPALSMNKTDFFEPTLSFSGDKSQKSGISVRDIIQAFVIEVNRRYGIIKQTEIIFSYF